MKYRFKHLVEYAALRTVVAVFSILPHRMALALAWGLARVAYHAVRWRVPAAHARIREVFPDMPPREVRRTAWFSLRSLFFNAVDVTRFPRLSRSWFKRHMEFVNRAHYEAAAREGRGGIFSLPHMGNWELSGLAAHHDGMPMFFLAARQKNPLVDELLNRMRGVTGIEMLLRDRPLLFRSVLRNLKQGKWLGTPNDLRSRTPGLSVQFMGKPMNLVSGIALFARRAGVPIIPTVPERVGWTRHRVVFHNPVWPDPAADESDDLHRMAQEVMDVFSDAVHKQPGQFFWYNKRWLLDPLESFAKKTEPGNSAAHEPDGRDLAASASSQAVGKNRAANAPR